jgi:hypothetical protein
MWKVVEIDVEDATPITVPRVNLVAFRVQGLGFGVYGVRLQMTGFIWTPVIVLVRSIARPSL